MDFESTDAPYDEWAEAYREWWAPVIGPAAVRVLDRLQDRFPREATFDLLDIGTGAGALALASLERWPWARVVGVDPAGGMLRLADEEARRLAPSMQERLQLQVGHAERLGLPDESVDAAVSSFVIQLVPSRAAALREIVRVLRPGGVFACVTWQEDDEPYEPDECFLRALEDLRIDPPPQDHDPRVYTTPQAAAAEWRRVGFGDVQARVEWLEHRYTPESYLDSLEHWVDTELFESMAPSQRLEVRSETLRHMRRLPAEAFVWRRPLISIAGTRRRR
jgi:SAM-dependent methyltransferase